MNIQKIAYDLADNEFIANAKVDVYIDQLPDEYDYEVATPQVNVKFEINIDYKTWGIQDISVSIPEQTETITVVIKDINDNEEYIQVPINIHQLKNDMSSTDRTVTITEISLKMNINIATKQITVDYSQSYLS